jgi:AcrR family transcriptional regulator
MSLYWHIRSQEELLDLMIDGIAARLARGAGAPAPSP